MVRMKSGHVENVTNIGRPSAPPFILDLIWSQPPIAPRAANASEWLADQRPKQIEGRANGKVDRTTE